MNQTNLIPAARRVAKHRQRAISRWVGIDLAFLAILIVAALAMFCLRSGSEARSRKAPTSTDVDKMNVTFAGLRQQATQLKANLTALNDLSGRPDWSVLLSSLSQIMNDDVVLNAVDCRVIAGQSNAGTTPAAGSGKPQLVIGGIGRSQRAVADFTLRVEGLRFFGGVQLVQTSANTQLGPDCVGFQLVCKWPGADRRRP